MKHKKLFIVAFLLIVIVIGGWIGFTKYALHRLREGVAQAERDLKAQGFSLTYTHLDVSGNPFSLKVDIKDMHLKNGVIDWSGERVHLSMRPWWWRRINYELQGAQQLTIQASPLSLKTMDLKGAHGHMAWASGHVPDQMTLQADSLKLSQDFSLQGITLMLKDLSTPLATAVDLTATVQGLPQPIVCTLNAHLGGFQTGTPFPKTLAEWRDGGGVLDVDVFRIVSQPLDIAGEGTLTFDADMFPLGSFSTRITGFEQGLNHMVSAGVIKDKNAAMAGFMLSLIARDNNGQKQINVPITLQNKHMTIGSIPLVKLGK